MPTGNERLLAQRWALPGALAVVFVALSVLVAVHHGSVVLHVDRPVTDWAVARRSPGWTSFFRAVTNLGNPGVAFAGGIVLAIVTYFRSRRTAVLLLLTALVRPLASTAVKDLVGRARPHVPELVRTTGASYPSGHVLAATMFWGAVPLALLVWPVARGFVRAAAVFAAVAVVIVACSRVYLGVHWLTDVVGGALLGVLLLVPVYRLSAVPRLDR